MTIKKIISYFSKTKVTQSNEKKSLPGKPVYKFYQSIDELPFENYAKITNGFEYAFDQNKKVTQTKSGDLRYLIMLPNYDTLPNIDGVPGWSFVPFAKVSIKLFAPISATCTPVSINAAKAAARIAPAIPNVAILSGCANDPTVVIPN